MNPNPEHVGQTTVIVSPVSESSMIRPFPPHFVHGSIFIQHSCDILVSAYATGLCHKPKCAASFVRRPIVRDHSANVRQDAISTNRGESGTGVAAPQTTSSLICRDNDPHPRVLLFAYLLTLPLHGGSGVLLHFQRS